MMAMTCIPFDGDELWAARADIDGEVLVAVKPIVTAIGMDWASQLARIRRDAVLSKGMVIMAIPSAGGPQETVCLPLWLVPGFLFGVSESAIRNETVRAKVHRYRETCFQVLWRHFFPAVAASDGVLHEEPVGRRVLMPGDAGFAEAVRLVREARLARGAGASLALWRMLGLPWTPELDGAVAVTDDPFSIGAWLAERVVDAPGIVTAAAVLMRDYAAWCAGKGVVAASAKGLGAELAGRGYRRHKASVIYWHGLRLAAAATGAPRHPEGP